MKETAAKELQGMLQSILQATHGYAWLDEGSNGVGYSVSVSRGDARYTLMGDDEVEAFRHAEPAIAAAMGIISKMEMILRSSALLDGSVAAENRVKSIMDSVVERINEATMPICMGSPLRPNCAERRYLESDMCDACQTSAAEEAARQEGMRCVTCYRYFIVGDDRYEEPSEAGPKQCAKCAEAEIPIPNRFTEIPV